MEYNKECPYLIGQDKENYIHDVNKAELYTEEIAFALSEIFLDMLDCDEVDHDFSSINCNTISGDTLYKNCFWQYYLEWIGIPIKNEFLIAVPEKSCIIPYELSTNHLRKIVQKFAYISTKISLICTYGNFQ